jgi:alpha-L-fucosidase
VSRPHGEGPSHGAQGAAECTARDIRFTRNKNNTRLYAILCGWPGDGATIEITSLKRRKISLKTLARAAFLGTNVPLAWKQEESGLKITLPASRPYTADAYPIRLCFSGQIPASPVLTLPPLFSADTQRRREPPVRLDEGECTTAQLQAAGINDKSVEAVKVNAGWTVILYDHDRFSGKSVTCSATVRTLGCEEFRFDRRTSSLKVIRAKHSTIGIDRDANQRTDKP